MAAKARGRGARELSEGGILRLLARIDKKISARRSIQLSPEEIDLLVSCGAYRCLVESALGERERAASERTNAPVREISASGNYPVASETAEEAAKRLERTLQLGRRRPKPRG